MAVSAHTPGPWMVTKLIPELAEENDYPGAEVSFREATGHDHVGAIQVWSERAEADARLIAVAPDYDSEARAFVAWVQNNSRMAPSLSDVQEWALRFAAAIAKTEGR